MRAELRFKLRALAAVLLLLGCGDGGSSPTTPPTPPTPPTPVATSITLSATSLSFSSIGATQQLSATVKDQNGAIMSGASVTWGSSSASIATVSSSGLVTSVADGAATITATSGSASGTASVTVAVPVSLELSDTVLSFLALGDTAQLTATVKNAAGSTISALTVTWATSDDAVATVSSAGLVTSVADGSTTVTATSGELSDTVAVTVLQTATSVELSDTVLTFPSLGDTATLSATVKDAAGSLVVGASVTWATSTEGVATVSDGGLVTAVTNGTATVTASSGPLEATAAVTVTQAASSIELSDTVLTFASLAETTQLTATVKDANDSTMSGATVTWSTSDTTVATVSSAGLVTSVVDGTATITAAAGSITATTSVTVTQGASSITVSPTSVSFASLADTATLTATVKDSGGTVMSGVTVSWTTSAASVATVSAAGLVTAVADGTVTLTATFGVLAATTSVTVAQVATSVTLSPTTISFASLGGTATLTATVKDANDSTMAGATVTWSTSAASVATVSSAGLVTSVSDGTATITATAGAASATASVTVAQVASSIELSDTLPTFASLAATTQLTATVKDANDSTISGATISWATSDTTIATVSASGLVTSVDNGTATITATSGSLTATASVTVSQVASTVTVSPSTKTFTAIEETVTLSVTVNDAGGTEMSGAIVTWASSDATVATVSSSGLVTSVDNGTATITATSGPASGTAQITVNWAGPTVATITATWTEGTAATITGSRFSATPASNTVTVDGLTASITSATTTELQITVPTYACKPSRVVDLVVTVASLSATKTVGVKPETVQSIGLGGGVYTTTSDCIHIEAGSASEKYIIGVFSTSESESSLTPYTQTAITGTVLAGEATPDIPVVSDEVGYFEAPIIAESDRPADILAPSRQLFIDPERQAERLAHAEAEALMWEEELRMMEDLASGRINPQAMAGEMQTGRATMPARSVGDTIAIKVHQSGNTCTDTASGGTGIYTEVNAVVRYIGTSTIYMEDILNPIAQSFSTAEYTTLDATFSNTTLPTLTNYFGDLVDGLPYLGVEGDTLGLDDDGRIGVLTSKAVNEKTPTVNGFVSGADLWATSSCPMSNQAELYYRVAPDPTGVHGRELSQQDLLDKFPRLMAHEVTHILQRTQDYLLGAASKARWELEGGATLAEQLVGNAALSHGGSGQNLGRTEFDEGYDADEEWYKNWIVDLVYYFGYGSSRVANAPEQCTWLAKNPPGPCGNGSRAVYGVPATLLRFILDYYGPSYSGGEAGLMRDLTSSAQTGYDNLVTTTGASSIRHIQTLFGLNLYSDGRAGVTQGTNTSALNSWDLYPITQRFVERARLLPYTSADTAPTSSHSVRGGSTAYLEWEPPSSHAPTSLRLRTPAGDALPSTMGMWIFRIQ